jgi:hypothetical protein
MNGRLLRFVGVLVVCVCSYAVAACHRNADAKPDADEEPKGIAPVSQADKDDKDRDDALKLDLASMAKLGIVVAPIAAATFNPEVTGFGQVLGRDAVIQALSEIEVARVRATQSHAALERSHQLQNTAGADTVAEHEAAVRQDAEDRTTVLLAQAKMSSLLGQETARALGAERELVNGVSTGRYKLVRATLPLGTVHGDAVPALRVARLDAAPGEENWRALRVWAGPTEAGMPGRTFLALFAAPSLAEGERLMAYAGTPGTDNGLLHGALVPSAAAVIVADDAWVYVEHETGRFSRERLDTTRPLPGGYFIAGKLGPGTRVITSGASMLLSREFDVSPED